MFAIYAGDEKLRYREDTVLGLLAAMSRDSREDDMGDVGYHGTFIDVFDAGDWAEYQTLHECDSEDEAREYREGVLEESGIPSSIEADQRVVHIWGSLDWYCLCEGDPDPAEVAAAISRANENVPVYRIVEE